MKKILCALFVAGLYQVANACTDVTIKAKDGSVVAGRAMEWEYPMGWEIITVPAGTTLTLTAPAKLGLPAHQVVTKYGIVGIDSKLMPGAIAEGQNSAGLGFSANFLPQFTQYQQISKDDKNYASVLEVSQLILGSVKTVEEAKALLLQYKIWGETVAVSPSALTLHLLITDKTGKSIVVEYIKGKINVYDNSIGVLTNAPEYPWHLYNLTNYLHLSDNDVTSDSTAADAIKTQFGALTQTSQGVGLIGLPGDDTSPSRFVRVTALRTFAVPATNDAEAVQLASHILNSTDVVRGSIKTVVTNTQRAYEYTQWVTLKDLTSNKMYFADYEHRTNFVSVDVNKLLASNKPVVIPIDKISYPDSDISNQLH